MIFVPLTSTLILLPKNARIVRLHAFCVRVGLYSGVLIVMLLILENWLEINVYVSLDTLQTLLAPQFVKLAPVNLQIVPLAKTQQELSSALLAQLITFGPVQAVFTAWYQTVWPTFTQELALAHHVPRDMFQPVPLASYAQSPTA